MAIGTNNGGGNNVTNCYWLSGSAPGGGYYGSNKGTVTELSETDMKNAASKLGSAFTADMANINGGYPILTWQSSSAAFTDVKQGGWSWEAVNYVMERGYFDLTGAQTFSPDDPMTRAMLATALYRMAGSPKTAGISATPFTDVSANSDYANAVAWCYENGIVNGRTDTTFVPSGTITRQEIAAMFYRYAKVTGADMTADSTLSAFTDAAKVSSWAKTEMRWCVGAGLINGMTGTTIAPSGTATRAQTAAMVMRLERYL
jgi:hypothetical protein